MIPIREKMEAILEFDPYPILIPIPVESLNLWQRVLIVIPMKTESGLHIFKVDERNSPDLTDAEKQQIISILRQQRFQEEWNAYTDSLIANAYIES